MDELLDFIKFKKKEITTEILKLQSQLDMLSEVETQALIKQDNQLK